MKDLIDEAYDVTAERIRQYHDAIAKAMAGVFHEAERMAKKRGFTLYGQLKGHISIETFHRIEMKDGSNYTYTIQTVVSEGPKTTFDNATNSLTQTLQ